MCVICVIRVGLTNLYLCAAAYAAPSTSVRVGFAFAAAEVFVCNLLGQNRGARNQVHKGVYIFPGILYMQMRAPRRSLDARAQMRGRMH